MPIPLDPRVHPQRSARPAPGCAARRAGVACALAFGLLLAAVPHAAAQSGPAEPAPGAEQNAELTSRLQSLNDIVRTQNQLRADRAKRQAELGSDEGRGREEQIRGAIRQLTNAIEQLDHAFALIASDVDPKSLEAVGPAEDPDFAADVRELLSPLVSELKRVTERPREIDRLRTEIGVLEQRIETMQRAILNLEALAEAQASPEVEAAVRAELGTWTSKLGTERTQLTVALQKLDQQLNARQSLSESLDDLFELFFKSRGRNLLIAILATMLFWLVLRRTHEQLRRHGPLGRTATSLWARIFDLAYMIFTAVGALFVFIVVLYFFGDWVLLIVVVLVLLGLVWASKQAIPRFWSQAMLLLDMGPVRDGERVVRDGIPYRIESLGLYSQLVNPLLEGGAIRLPIDDLSGLRSREVLEGEAWYPTQKGDWVLLPDGTFGQIEWQSIETVRLRRAGGTLRSYPVAEFLQMGADVLSRGFLVVVTFGVDYRHQSIVTEALPQTLRAFLERGIERHGRAGWTVTLGVEFAAAGASSLDVKVLWEVTGEAAPSYYSAQRLIQRLCVDACNENGWVIPFTQVTVHRAEGD